MYLFSMHVILLDPCMRTNKFWEQEKDNIVLQMKKLSFKQ